jgi:excisionase family DNA binding protein
MPAQYAPQATTTVEPLLTVNEVSRVLRRSRSFVYALVRDGDLHPVRVGARLRFGADDVRGYLDRLRVEASGTAA